VVDVMKRTALALALVSALLFSVVAGTWFASLASAQSSEMITINADGSIDPSTAPIQRNGDVYTLTGDIDGYVVLARNNTFLDGAEHAAGGIYGPLPVQVGYQWLVNGTTNITIVNAVVSEGGIIFAGSTLNSIIANNTLDGGKGINFYGDGNTISGNNITDSDVFYGSIAFSGSNNIIAKNRMTNTKITGINIGGSNNTISGNYIIGGNASAISFSQVSYKNVVFGNQIENNRVGISTFHVFGYDFGTNTIYYNNFVNNTQNLYSGVIAAPSAINDWDNGALGNYWSDYNGTDANGDGIGDSPYVIGASNQDRYPLIDPVDVSNLALASPSPSPSPTPTPSTTTSPSSPSEPTSSPEIPEFPLRTILPLFMIASLITALFYFKKLKHKRN
jgi:hypothetical protein